VPVPLRRIRPVGVCSSLAPPAGKRATAIMNGARSIPRHPAPGAAPAPNTRPPAAAPSRLRANSKSRPLGTKLRPHGVQMWRREKFAPCNPEGMGIWSRIPALTAIVVRSWPRFLFPLCTQNVETLKGKCGESYCSSKARGGPLTARSAARGPYIACLSWVARNRIDSG